MRKLSLVAATGVVGLILGSLVAFADVQTASCRTALLVIDVQTAWLNTRAKTVDGCKIQEKIVSILELARPAGIPVIFVVDVSRRGIESERRLAVAHPIEVLESDFILEKRHKNGFILTTLEDDLHAMGITTLLITGFASHECVRSTVKGALRRDFETIIIEDGHSGGEGGRRATSENATWRSQGLRVIRSGKLDFATLCLPPEPEEDG